MEQLRSLIRNIPPSRRPALRKSAIAIQVIMPLMATVFIISQAYIQPTPPRFVTFAWATALIALAIETSIFVYLFRAAFYERDGSLI